MTSRQPYGWEEEAMVVTLGGGTQLYNRRDLVADF